MKKYKLSWKKFKETLRFDFSFWQQSFSFLYFKDLKMKLCDKEMIMVKDVTFLDCAKPTLVL